MHAYFHHHIQLASLFFNQSRHNGVDRMSVSSLTSISELVTFLWSDNNLWTSRAIKYFIAALESEILRKFRK